MRRTNKATMRLRHNRVKVCLLVQHVGLSAALNPEWDSGHQPRQPEREDGKRNSNAHREAIEILLDHR